MKLYIKHRKKIKHYKQPILKATFIFEYGNKMLLNRIVAFEQTYMLCCSNYVIGWF